jgi:predicted Zn-dependent protease
LIQVFNRLPDGPEDVSNSNRKAFLATAIGTYFGFDRREKESETWLLRAIKFAPQRDALPYQNLGRLYLRTDQELKAYRILMECKALFPEAQDTYVLLGSVYERQGLYDEGIRELEPLLKTGRAEPSDYSALGCLLDYKGDLSSAVTILREGHNKHPEDRSIIHNLAYVLLMNHELAEGRQILETYRDDLEDYASKDLDYESVLTATRGLLYLLEGRVDVGVQLYKQAARSASRVGSRQLAGAVLQKMHIEMTKLFLSRSDYASAKREIAAGLAIKRGREPFRRELKLLEVATNNVQ